MSSREEFDILVEKRLAGSVTLGEQAQLKSMLAQDAELRAEFLIAVSQEAALKAIHRKPGEAAQSAARTRTVRKPSNYWIPALGICALLAVGVLLYFVVRSNPAPSFTSVAKLKDASSGTSVLRGGKNVPLSNPLEVVASDEIRCPQSNSATIEYADATQVDLKQNTSVIVDPAGRFVNGKCIRIEHGKLSAVVSKQPSGNPMAFISPQAEAIVLGTKLEVEVGNNSTKLSVLEGNVRFASIADGKALEVAGGESAVAGNGAVFAVIRNIAPPPANSARVRDGLQALYTFREGTGETVKDVSGTADAMNLTISDAAGVSWLKNGGLEVHGVVKISTADNAAKVLRASKQSGAISVETWIEPIRIDPNTFRYVLTLHGGSGVHLMEIAQHGDEHHSNWQFNLETVPNAHHHAAMVEGPRAPVADGRVHLVFTRDAAGVAKAYVNGVEQAHAQMNGDLSAWDEHHFFTLGGDGTSRVWNGEFHLVAIYDRALNAADVKRNFDAGTQ